MGSRNRVFRTNIRVLLGGTVENTGRLLRMLPGVFREISSTFFHFSRVLLARFLEQRISFLWRVKNEIIRTGAGDNGSLKTLDETS